MRKLLPILGVLLMIYATGCSKNPLTPPAQEPQQEVIENPPLQDLIDFACGMVENNAYQISEIISFGNYFQVVKMVEEGSPTIYYITGECVFIDVMGDKKVATFTCGIRLDYGKQGKFSGYGAYIFEFSIFNIILKFIRK